MRTNKHKKYAEEASGGRFENRVNNWKWNGWKFLVT